MNYGYFVSIGNYTTNPNLNLNTYSINLAMVTYASNTINIHCIDNVPYNITNPNPNSQITSINLCCGITIMYAGIFFNGGLGYEFLINMSKNNNEYVTINFSDEENKFRPFSLKGVVIPNSYEPLTLIFSAANALPSIINLQYGNIKITQNNIDRLIQEWFTPVETFVNTQ